MIAVQFFPSKVPVRSYSTRRQIGRLTKHRGVSPCKSVMSMLAPRSMRIFTGKTTHDVIIERVCRLVAELNLLEESSVLQPSA